MVLSGVSLAVYEAKSPSEFALGKAQLIMELLGVKDAYK